MKKVILFLMIATMLCSVLTGCRDHSSDETTQIEDVSTADATTPETTVSAEVESIVSDVDEITYIQYNAMSSEEQKAVVDSFNNIDDFFEWYDDIKQVHNEFQDLVNNSQEDPTEESELNEEQESSKPTETDGMTFLEYHSLSAAEQKAFISTFSSIDKFVEWHTTARKEYEDSLIDIGLDGKPIDETEVASN